MIRKKQVMAIARAERLITRRLVRYWFFIGLAFFIALYYTLGLSFYHASSSSYSGTVGALSPRFLLSVIGLLYIAIFLVGSTFLAFDIRARDKRERVIEVLDSKPFSNLELVTGRFVGVFLSLWIPLIVLVILIEVFGITLNALSLPFGEPIEIFSLFSFVFLMAVPAFSFVIALAFLVTLLVRSRLAAAVIIIGMIGIPFWATFNLPLVYGMLFDIIGLSSFDFASDIIPHFATTTGWMQRFSVLFAAFGFLGFSAAVHPRLDGGSRLKLTFGSIAVMASAFLLIGFVHVKNAGDIRTIETWKEAHADAAFGGECVPDLKKIAGNIKVTPGKDLYLDLDIIFEAPDEGSLEKALFTLNPRQEVKSVSDSSGNPIAFTHEKGLLVISLSQTLRPGEETAVHLTIQGLPDNRFAFLYSAINPKNFKLSLERLLTFGEAPGVLGTYPGIFHKDFVALMAGLRWLPASGPEKGRDDPRIRAVDYYNVDLKVALPKGWLAVGPGQRQIMEGNSNGVSYRFSPQAPVPEAALIASRFESRSTEVEGVALEVLVHKNHMNNLDVLADTGEKIREWVGNRLREAKEYGLGYPYDALTLVEVPNTLRSYGGGWRMNTAMAPPGMLLMREIGFPTARFDSAFRNPDRFRDSEGGIQRAKLSRLKTFFTNDFSGGNILSGAARNFFLNQTSAKGPEGFALNYIIESLTNLLITETMGYYSAHQLFVGFRVLSHAAKSDGRPPLGETSLLDTAIEFAILTPGTWDKALGVSLKEIDPWEDPARTVDILILKGNAIARSILDTLGRDKTWQLLASIRRSYKGKSFSLNDMVEAGKTLGVDLTEILTDRINSANLPGFVCQKATICRITDSEDGNPRYQILFSIRNDESVSGFFRLAYEYGEAGENKDIIKSVPIGLKGKSAVQFGTIVSRPPSSVFLEPYLSLNRGSFSLHLNKPDEGKIEKAEAIKGLQELPYAMPQQASIVVDDLDPGFHVLETEKAEGLRINARGNKEIDADQGLPIAQTHRIPPTWSRMENPGSYGKYRHTLAVVGAGEGKEKAVFRTDIGQAGQWDLELYFPSKQGIMPGRKWGTYHLVIANGNGDQREINFDSQSTSPGWNLAESIDLPQGETTVTISNETDGQFIVADAIRWSPSAGF